MSRLGRTRSVAGAVAWRGIHLMLTNPILLLPGLLFPLFFFTAFAGGLSGVQNQPEFDYRSGYTAFQFVFVCFQASAFGGVFTSAFNGAGDTWTPTWLNFGIFWLFEIPLAWALAHPFGMGPRGVFVAIAVAFSVLAVVSGIVFRRGRWKTRVV